MSSDLPFTVRCVSARTAARRGCSAARSRAIRAIGPMASYRLRRAETRATMCWSKSPSGTGGTENKEAKLSKWRAGLLEQVDEAVEVPEHR